MSPQDTTQGELHSIQSLIHILKRLRAPNGCPWDREQTHASLKRNLLEAIDGDNSDKLSEELGDLLVQIAFHSQIAKEAGEFGLDDVLSKANTKLISRHTFHVFGDTKVADAKDVERRWEQLKKADQPKRSPVDGIPNELPALGYAQLMQDRVARVDFEWEDISGVLDKVVEEVQELREAATEQDRTKELGDLIFSVVNLARWMDIHPEDALRLANHRFQRRFPTMEQLADQRGLDFTGLPLEDKEELWQEAKGLESPERSNG